MTFTNGSQLAIASVLLLVAGEVSGSEPSFEGAEMYSLVPQVIEHGTSQEPITILITMIGQGPKVAIGRTTVTLAAGLKWVDGDLEHVGHPSLAWNGPRDNQWSIKIRALGSGSTNVRLSLTVRVSGHQTDESVMSLPIVVSGDELAFGTPRRIRSETVRNGQRYRYAGLFLVPIEGPEDVTTSDIVHGPAAIYKQAGTCTTCPAGPFEVSLVAFVGTDGKLISSRYLEGQAGGDADEETIRAAQRALSRWRFTPARTKFRKLAHWMFVRVPMQGR